MRVKKKKVKIDNQELKPTVLATVKGNNFNPLYLIGIFLVFGLIVFYLPNIALWVNKTILHKTSNNELNIYNSTNDKKYFLSKTLTIEDNNKLFLLSDFSTENDIFQFKITNKSDKQLDINKYHYILEIYDDNSKLIDSIILKDINLDVSGEKILSYKLDNYNINYFILR